MGNFSFFVNVHFSKFNTARPRRRWKENITMDLKHICVSTRNWVHLAQYYRGYLRALANAAFNFLVA